MSRKTFLIGVLITLSIIFGYCMVQFDKIGNRFALLCGFPVWIVAFLVIVGTILAGMRWRPVNEPGASVETPNWLFWVFGGIFFLALWLGIYFTEPVVCTAKDGDVCYESDTAWNVRGRDGGTYTGYYRNRWVWFAGDVIDSAVSPGYYSSGVSGGSGIGDMFSKMDLDDSEAAIVIFLIILLLILAISSAFVPNLWVVVCGIALVCFFLTILRLHNSEVQEKRKNAALDSPQPAETP